MDRPLRVTLDIEPGDTPIAGRLETADGEQRAFAGWLELVEALAAAVARGRPAGEPPPGP